MFVKRTGGARLVAGVVTAALALGVAACGGSSSSSHSASTTAAAGGGAGGGMTTVKVGVVPIASAIPLQMGVDKGFFARHGLKLDTTTALTGASIIPSLVSGDLQFAFNSWGGMFPAIAAKLPVIAVSPGDVAGRDAAHDYVHLISAKRSGITSVEQLAGKTVGVGALGNLSHLNAVAMLAAHGVAQDKVRFLPIPLTEMGTALRKGQIDAALMQEPLLSETEAQLPVNDLGGAQVETLPAMPASLFLTSKSYYAAHRDTVRAFQLGMQESLAYAQAHPDEVRAAIPAFAGVPAAVARTMILPQWSSTFDPAAVQQLADLALRFGFVKQRIDVAGSIAPFPLP